MPIDRDTESFALLGRSSSAAAADTTRRVAMNRSVTPPRERGSVIGVPIDVITWDEAIARLTRWSRARESRVVCVCAVHSVVTAHDDAEFRGIIRKADMATPDGAPVAFMLRRTGFAGQQRINGPDLMWKYCERAQHNGEKIFLYGGQPEVLEKLTAVLKTRFPGIAVVGAYSPPFRDLTEQEDEVIVGKINASGAGVVWVGLGCPKQERWMEAHRGRINAVMVGVGAAFDYHAGTLRRAPVWMQRRGLEWLYRLGHEPRRLWKRYLSSNTTFVLAAARQLALQEPIPGQVSVIDGWNYGLKRLQDVSVASVALVLLAPLLVGVAIAIKLESRGPILFRQKRLGFDGQTFELWKFRSMYADLESNARVTRLGRFIRQTGIEELPQLINVLQGRMSIVGPRPHAMQTTPECKMLEDSINNYAARHWVKPGITGWAQVHGLRGGLTSIEQLTQRVQFDREYIQRRSMLLDARIIVMTLGRIANDPNAY
jgi:N-acetylglucosaminyldiphosphoundecaprenol N-acetyl-beta-D-mannosaminyltransferase